MIRFVDLRKAETGYRFAFFDTVVDRFVGVGGTEAWDDLDDFLESAIMGHMVPSEKERYVSLMPAWAKKGGK